MRARRASSPFLPEAVDMDRSERIVVEESRGRCKTCPHGGIGHVLKRRGRRPMEVIGGWEDRRYALILNIL